MMKKQMIFAAPFLAAVTFVCQPMLADDQAINRAANPSDRPVTSENTGADANRAANRAGQTAAEATNAARAGGEAQVAGARDQAGMDQKCAMHVSDMNNFEIQTGKLAQEKAQREEIKQVGKMMVDDHTQAQQQLQQIAQRKSMTLPSQLMPVHQAKLDELKKLDGEQFDRAYLYGQVAGHTEAVLWLRDSKSDLKDEDLRQYTTAILPKVQQHLKHVQHLANAGEAVPAGARIDSGAAHDGGNTPERTGPGATDRVGPADDAAGNNTGGRPGRGSAPAPAPGAGPSAPGESR